MYRIGGELEGESQGALESTVGYHSWIAGVLTCYRDPVEGTVSGGQFDWGGRLPKSNGAPEGFLSADGNRAKECKGIRELDCEQTCRAEDEIELSDPAVPSGRAVAHPDKSYPGDNRLISPEFIDRRFGTSMSAHHPGAERRSQGLELFAH